MRTPDDPLSRIFAALADPTRRDILARLESGPITVGDLADDYPISRPAVSQHLRVLEDAGLIERTVNAQWRVCALQPGGMSDAAAWIAEHRGAWNERFDLLEQLLRKET
ncbi:ArsR/SmtB family transcription factor [Rhodococcus sp. NPDC058521]|uniref:ArsR/SmtB family transcription factor n=1 Tax=Rhodococcus sp. NPDC058521 TaxID=3346536 RepID=UPI003652A734